MRARMKARKWSVKYVAERSGVSRQTIYALQRGEHPPTLDTQRGLADALEVEPDWVDRILAGKKPVEVEAPPAGAVTRSEFDRLAAEVARLARDAQAARDLTFSRVKLFDHLADVEMPALLERIERLETRGDDQRANAGL